MLTVAYLANQYPASLEPYVSDEIEALRSRGVKVIAGSIRRPRATSETPGATALQEILFLLPIRALPLLRSFGLAAGHWRWISALLGRVLLKGQETPQRRFKAVLHTWLGVYYAALIGDQHVDHIHIHHGYFGSWIGMVAAHLLGIRFSFTLHGSDLLLSRSYLDVKLSLCEFCITISEYNRRYILANFPQIEATKISVSRLGVETLPPRNHGLGIPSRKFTLLAVGRLRAVKNHTFLVYACARLRDYGLDFECLIAGEGPERTTLELLIQRNRLQDQISLVGHIPRGQIDSVYARADLVVLTSHSEGIPLVLMEAMARGIVVVAPAITGISELVVPGKTGFLYRPSNLQDFVDTICFLQTLMKENPQALGNRLNWIRHAAQTQVSNNFSRQKSLDRFVDRFLRLTA